MKLRFVDRAVTGVLLVLPANEVRFEDELGQYDFPAEKSLRLKQMMGFDRRRVVASPAVCASDLCVHGLQHLFDRGQLKPADIDGLIFVSQTPDYLMPPTSNVIQGRLGLKTDVLCLDINQGCAGYVVGLVQAFLMLEQPSIRKVVLLNGDTLSRKVSPRDRSINPMTGDAASITVVERRLSKEIYATVQMDGSRSQALAIPAGGMRQPANATTAELKPVGDGNFRSLEHFVMDGTEVFNFVQLQVPPMISGLLADANATDADVDTYFFHQPNKFMLEKLADRMKVPRAKVPANVVENFGNASSVTIPANLVLNAAERLRKRTMRVCLAGFGVGLTWASMLLELGPLDFCERIDF